MKVGSKVRIISGSSKNKEGIILKIKDMHIFVKDVKMVNFTEKLNDGSRKISKKESKIHISNIKLISL
jgi:ribosomal protein L24